ncbi:Uncharacterized protein Fot_56514 [Forsythia ovata]|uniref:Uncharacterized protein n=1 Tax=Forsythia ovata TaxID=205694 RepID=A0ABD1P195_9LAMI
MANPFHYSIGRPNFNKAADEIPKPNLTRRESHVRGPRCNVYPTSTTTLALSDDVDDRESIPLFIAEIGAAFNLPACEFCPCASGDGHRSPSPITCSGRMDQKKALESHSVESYPLKSEYWWVRYLRLQTRKN